MMSGNNNKKVFKRKIASKYRINGTKRIALAKLQARAARSIDYSDDSDSSDNNSIHSFENFTDFDPKDSFERENFQENTLCSDPSSDGNFNSPYNSINNSINNDIIDDYIMNDNNRDHDSIDEREREEAQDYDIDDTTLNFYDKEQLNDYLLNMLREWALRGVSKKKVDALLTLLIPIFPFLPKSHKTLLRTSRKVNNVFDENDGQFWYKVYNNPTYFNASPLQKKLHGTSSSSFEKTISLSEASTTKDTSISCKSMTSQPSHNKSSLPSLMKDVHMQLNPHVAAVLQILVNRQEELNGKIEHVVLMLHRINRKLAPEEEEKIIKPKGLPSLPLNDEDAFSEFQKFLISDDNFYPAVDYFSTLMKVDEQTDEYTAVGHMLPKLVTNSLARMINYAGSGSIK